MPMLRAALVLTLVSHAAAARADDPPAAVWKVGQPISLFDGKTLQGWTTPDGKPVKQGWTVQEGAIHRDGRGGNILYERRVGDFELSFEWKIVAGGNNGLKYRVRKYGGRLLGCEYQLLGEKGRSLTNKSCGSLYDLYEPNEQKQVKAPGEWNTARIVAHGTRIEHWMNGAKIVEAEIGTEEWETRHAKSKFAPHANFARNTRGRIMLTDHGSKVWYRNLVLTPLEDRAIPQAPVEQKPAETPKAPKKPKTPKSKSPGKPKTPKAPGKTDAAGSKKAIGQNSAAAPAGTGA